MDPDVTLKLLVEALEAGKPYAAKDRFYDLFEWLKADGYPPRFARHLCTKTKTTSTWRTKNA